MVNVVCNCNKCNYKKYQDSAQGLFECSLLLELNLRIMLLAGLISSLLLFLSHTHHPNH